MGGLAFNFLTLLGEGNLMTLDRKTPRGTRLASLAVGVTGLLIASGVQAQSASPVVLDCAAGQSTTSVTLGTDASWSQSNDGGTTWGAAVVANNGGWSAAPSGSSWIGDGSNGASTYQFMRVLQLGAGVDTATPLTVNTTFLADDRLDSLTIGGVSAGASGGTYTGSGTSASASVTLPSAGDYPIVAKITNTGGAYGLALSMTVTATCRAATPAAVPADAPWALGLLAGMIGVAAAALGRRRRRG